ncbi:unnamed protein product [Euphydryas editha]|uniref:Uncharacterized protein n=1 Tax=Euphydryas editha TaxID=104508 RepID=A0AAU9URG3_EUPED|nr:unnamed protein product [Euphydryas editha]
MVTTRKLKHDTPHLHMGRHFYDSSSASTELPVNILQSTIANISYNGASSTLTNGPSNDSPAVMTTELLSLEIVSVTCPIEERPESSAN